MHISGQVAWQCPMGLCSTSSLFSLFFLLLCRLDNLNWPIFKFTDSFFCFFKCWAPPVKKKKIFFSFWLSHGIWSFWARDQIRTVATTYAGSLTHCVGPGIKPMSEHSRDATNPVAPQQELQKKFGGGGLCPWYAEVPRAGTEPAPQQQPKPPQWHWIPNLLHRKRTPPVNIFVWIIMLFIL